MPNPDQSDFEDARQEEARKKPQFFAAKTPTKSIATHTVAEGDTLGQIALKYYGNAAKPFWTLIYDANKKVIGDNPNQIRPGMEIEIPELPEDTE